MVLPDRGSNRRWIHALAAYALLCVVMCRMCSATDFYGQQASCFIEIDTSIQIYRIESGQLPQTDATSTWVEKLIRVGLVYETDEFLVSGEIVDIYDQPLVYIVNPPGSATPYTLYSIGENGIDEGGLGDDWDSRGEPRFGTWWKRDWPGGIVRLVAGAVCSVVLAATLCICGFGLLRSSSLLFLLTGISIGVLAGGSFDSPLGVSMTGRPRDSYPPDGVLGVIFSYGGDFLFAVGIAGFMLHAAANVMRRSRRAKHLCPNCSYALEGLASDRCPECGVRHRSEAT